MESNGGQTCVSENGDRNMARDGETFVKDGSYGVTKN